MLKGKRSTGCPGHLPWALLAHGAVTAKDHCSSAFLLGTMWGSNSGGLSQQLGAQGACCHPPWTGKQLWDPALLLALYFCSPSTTPALPGHLAECAVAPALTAIASIHGYTKEHLLVK